MKPGIFDNWQQAVLFATLGLIFWLILGYAVFAQSASGAVSGSAAYNKNLNAAGSVSSGNSVNVTGSPANTRSTVDYGGDYTIKSAPAVSAPAIFGGGHPCLAGKSGGVSVIGGGLTYGQGNPEPACMAWIMGQPEVALSVMFATDPAFRRATCRVGFWRVGNSQVPVDCRGRAAEVAATVSTKAQSPLLSSCKLSGDRTIKVRYTAAGRKDKAAANAQCAAHLGL